jgi:hypothetical protein
MATRKSSTTKTSHSADVRAIAANNFEPVFTLEFVADSEREYDRT